jgi:hypothetical protein
MLGLGRGEQQEIKIEMGRNPVGNFDLYLHGDKKVMETVDIGLT